MIWISNYIPQALSELFDANEVAENEIQEVENLGLVQLFGLEIVEREVSILDVMCVAFLSFAQFVVGAVCMTTGMASIGVTLISNGIQDMLKVAKVMSGELAIGDYFIGKGIEIAVHFITQGIEAIASKITGRVYTPLLSTTATSEIAADQFVRDQIVRIVLTTAVGIGMDEVITSATRFLCEEFKGDIRDTVEEKMQGLFGNKDLRENLRYILLMDVITNTNRGERAIYHAINDTIKSKHSLANTIAEQTLISASHSQNALVRGAAYGLRLGKAGHDLANICDFADSFCQSFEGRIAYIKSCTPTLAEVLYKQAGLGSRQDAERIMELLIQNGILGKDRITNDFVASVSSCTFEEYFKSLIKGHSVKKEQANFAAKRSEIVGVMKKLQEASSCTFEEYWETLKPGHSVNKYDTSKVGESWAALADSSSDTTTKEKAADTIVKFLAHKQRFVSYNDDLNRITPVLKNVSKHILSTDVTESKKIGQIFVKAITDNKLSTSEQAVFDINIEKTIFAPAIKESILYATKYDTSKVGESWAALADSSSDTTIKEQAADTIVKFLAHTQRFASYNDDLTRITPVLKNVSKHILSTDATERKNIGQIFLKALTDNKLTASEQAVFDTNIEKTIFCIRNKRSYQRASTIRC